MPGANSEQLKAIERTGGALLGAGAGSGKTFVLTEHLVHLAGEWIDAWSSEREPDFGAYIKSRFSKVVLMTFTRKAAGEIGIRIVQKFEAQERENADDPRLASLWKAAVENLDALTVSTIHGYCYKLIKQGFFADVNPNDDIIGEGEFAKQIEDIFASWLEANLDEGGPFLKLVFKEKKAVLDALKKIISDPTLRLMWKTVDPAEFGREDADRAVEELLFHQSFNELFDWDGSLAAWSEFSDKPWFGYLERVSSFVRQKDLGLRAVNDFARSLAENNFSIPRKPTAKAVPQDAKELYESAKDFKNFLKSVHEDLFCFEEEGEELVRQWYGNFRRLFESVESAYASSPGFTFGDLEHVVNQKLEDPAVRKTVKQEYDYIIVDEFQDTSFIQFNIISKIVDGDFSKVFCVGDVKQAIYGFRGGELGVFLEMEKKTPLNLKLLNNYRSDKDIIKFNNALFEHVFKLGMGFKGKDHYAVEAAAQTVPLEERPEGEIFEIEADASFLEESLTKLSNADVEYLEAIALAEEIKNSVRKGVQTAVLYRKLKPSKVLMRLLLAEGIGFTSQVKVPMLEDPVLGIFHLLAKSGFDRGKLKDRYMSFALDSYFKLLGAEPEKNLLQSAKEFEGNTRYYGVYQAFLVFLSGSGICVSNYQQSLENIKLLSDLAKGALPGIVRKLEEWSDLSYSMDFQYGENPDRVVVMSAHASKGLEFPKVLLGGVYTNDSSMPVTDMFGKIPYSFKWSKSLEEKKRHKSPHYLLETAKQKRKEFSESKRLFYVACTRAENSLGWVRLRFGGVKPPKVGGSWIYGLDSFLLESEQGRDFAPKIKQRSVGLEERFDPEFLNLVSNQPPMFHFDNLGVETKLESSDAFLMPELSVTRLAHVAQCPRKFYLANVLKLEAGEKEKEDFFPGDADELSSKSFSSSAGRGIEIHDILSEAIKSDFQDLGTAHRAQTEWVVDKLQSLGENRGFVSEKPIKFELFQYMISGIPDLIVLDGQGDCAEVWDFKTGGLRGSPPENYWFQLFAYAYAMRGKKQKPTRLVLCYVDERRILDKKVSPEEVENYLWRHCRYLGLPDETRPDHCSFCDYNKICKGKSLSSCATSFS